MDFGLSQLDLKGLRKKRKNKNNFQVNTRVVMFAFLIECYANTADLLARFLVSSCALGFLLGLLFTQRSGNYFVTMFDDYSATLPLVIVVIFEAISVAWVYGTDR